LLQPTPSLHQGHSDVTQRNIAMLESIANGLLATLGSLNDAMLVIGSFTILLFLSFIIQLSTLPPIQYSCPYGTAVFLIKEFF